MLHKFTSLFYSEWTRVRFGGHLKQREISRKEDFFIELVEANVLAS